MGSIPAPFRRSPIYKDSKAKTSLAARAEGICNTAKEDAMRKCVLLFVVALLAALPHHAGAQIRITHDTGGVMEAYMKKLQGWRDSGQPVWIDGICLSSCTMVLGFIPANRICVTPRAVLGFHAAWNPSRYGKHIHHKGTNRLMEIYPPIIRNWIASNGGLTPEYKYLRGRELSAMYKPCPQSNLSGSTIGR
jgi:hypothetical protein